ncbi:hypothetical protein BHE74_00022563, partial [Ensete ventricosum]
HSDVNLVGLDKEAAKENDRAALLEGGLPRSSSARFHNASVRANLIRLLEDSSKVVWFTILLPVRETRFSLPSGKTRIARYIPVRQLIGMQIDGWRSIEGEKGQKKKRRRSTLHRPSDNSARGSPASRRCLRCPSVVAACAALAPLPPALP